MSEPKKLADEYRELAENHNRLAEKFNKLVAERKKDKILMEEQHSIVQGLKLRLVSEWPSALSGFVGMINFANPTQIEAVYLKSLINDFEELVRSDSHHRDEEIILAHLIGKALYKYFWKTSLDHLDCERLLDMMIQYLNANSRYLRVESHGLTKHFDGRFHETEVHIQEMEKIRLASFLIWDSNRSDNILRKALVLI